MNPILKTTMKKLGLIVMLFFIPMQAFASPPPAESVFQVTVKPLDPNAFTLNWQIKKGFFIYQKSIRLAERPDSNAHLGQITLPTALQKTAPHATPYAIYRNHLTLSVPILGTTPGESLLDVFYQGCSVAGFCYPPQHRQIKLSIDDHSALTHVSLEGMPNRDEILLNKSTESEPLYQLFTTHNWVYVIVSFFGFGVLLAFTPCVLPMIPVLSGIIVGHGKDLSTRKAFFLSLSYVLSMSITYSVIGAIIAFMGNNLQVALQSTWAVGLFSLLFIMLALSMFGLYELRLPLSWQNKMATLTRSQSGGHYFNAALMGSLSILILSPCVTAPLIGALSYIAREGSVSLGIFSLFFLGLGMGTPLLLIGTSAGKCLPKAGQWMNEVKVFFGVLMLGVAIYLLNRILPSMLIMLACSSLLVFSGIYLGALCSAHSKLEKFNQGAGLLLLVYGFLILIGASQGHRDPLFPLKQTHSTPLAQRSTLTTLPEVQAALAEAASNETPVVLDFYADWCASCKTIANTTLRDPRVLTALKRFTLITVDLTPNNADTHTLLSYLNVIAPPTFLFFDAKGNNLEELRLMGEISVKDFLGSLREV